MKEFIAIARSDVLRKAVDQPLNFIVIAGIIGDQVERVEEEGPTRTPRIRSVCTSQTVGMGQFSTGGVMEVNSV